MSVLLIVGTMKWRSLLEIGSIGITVLRNSGSELTCSVNDVMSVNSVMTVHVMLSWSNVSLLSRWMWTFVGEFNVVLIGMVIHFVPMELWSRLHVRHDFDPAPSEYSLASLLHCVHFDAFLVDEYFPASHRAQEIAPEVLAFPALHGSHSFDAGCAPTQPAGHVRNGSQLSSWQLVM